MKTTSLKLRALAVRFYLGAHLLLALGVVSIAAFQWQCHDPLRFISYLASALIASVLKVRLPGVPGAASVSFLFVLIGIVDLSVPQATAIACLSMLTQCYFVTERRPKLIQVCFNLANSAISVFVAGWIYGYAKTAMPEPAALGALAVAYHFANTFPVAGIIALTESIPVLPLFTRNYKWLLPYYAGGASLAWLIGTMPHAIQWEVPIICLPVVYLVHRSYNTHLTQMQQEKKHMQELNLVNLRTIETLALAIDAKDHTTHNHVQRVRLYSLEIGKELGLTPDELEALAAASVLHDIGKLAVPEQIISKPGKLTPAEFQKMKIHPIVGAEILERVAFPYPVVPIVRSHHEKWNGTGYPDGLKGAHIPIGARVLALVDCFDALTSDRQYRRALPVDEAIAKVVSEAGTSFDPAVVDVLERRYCDLEAKARELSSNDAPALSTDITVTRGAAPAAGFETSTSEEPMPAETGGELGPMPAVEGLSLEETVAVIAVRVRKTIAYDTFVFFFRDSEMLRPAFTAGPHAERFSALNVPVGTGLVGWVAECCQPIINGNPSVEPGYSREGVQDGLQSALAVPLVDGRQRVFGVLAAYRCGSEAFSAQQAGALMRLGRPLARLIEKRKAEGRAEVGGELGSTSELLRLAESMVASPGVH